MKNRTGIFLHTLFYFFIFTSTRRGVRGNKLKKILGTITSNLFHVQNHEVTSNRHTDLSHTSTLPTGHARRGTHSASIEAPDILPMCHNRCEVDWGPVSLVVSSAVRFCVDFRSLERGPILGGPSPRPVARKNCTADDITRAPAGHQSTSNVVLWQVARPEGAAPAAISVPRRALWEQQSVVT